MAQILTNNINKSMFYHFMQRLLGVARKQEVNIWNV